MSEVKRISVFIHGPNKKVGMVEAVHLDRVTAERDALQQLLTAADERADVLEGLLQTINAKASKSHISQSLWQLKTDMASIAQDTEAALKPAQGKP